MLPTDDSERSGTTRVNTKNFIDHDHQIRKVLLISTLAVKILVILSWFTLFQSIWKYTLKRVQLARTVGYDSAPEFRSSCRVAKLMLRFEIPPHPLLPPRGSTVSWISLYYHSSNPNNPVSFHTAFINFILGKLWHQGFKLFDWL